MKGDKGDPGRDGMQVDGTAGQTLVHNGTTWVATDELSVAKLDVSKLNVKPDSVAANDTINEPLFAVKDRNGNIVFAVYPDGVRVYVDEQTKARRSGFVVTGRSATKDGEANNYFSVNDEGTQVFIDTASSKARRSGFVVTGREATKDGDNTDFFKISDNGTQVFVDEDDTNGKARRSGFVVTGRSASKDNQTLFAVDLEGTTGDNTAALGQYAEAGGTASTAMGYYASASGDFSTAFGEGSESAGKGSFAAGNYSTALGSYSTSLGQFSTAKGPGSFAAGSSAEAIGDVSLAIGQGSRATGEYAMAIGSNAVVDSSPVVTYYEVLGGLKDSVVVDSFPSSGSFAIGSNAEALGEGVMAIGNGASATGRFSFAIGNYAHAYGSGSIAMGPVSRANGQSSIAIGGSCEANNAGVAIGFSTKADCAGSFAIGTDCDAKGWGSVALGKSATAKADLSFCIGEASKTFGKTSICIGFNSETEENHSIAIGNYIFANNPWEIVLGKFNDSTKYEGYDRLFSFGCGRGWSDWRNAMVILDNGNIGMGTSTPNYQLEVNGTIKANNVSETSDIRLKRDITNLDNSLQKVLKLRGVNFYWKSEEEIKTALGTHEKCQYPETKQVGVIAQEVEEVVPEVVATDAKGFKSVDYSKLVPVLVEAIKEQQKQIEELRRMVEELQSK